MKKINNLVEAFNYAQKNGGVTYHLLSGNPPKYGFMVGGVTPGWTLRDLNIDSFRMWIKDNIQFLIQENKYIGVWQDPDTGLWHLDVSQYIETYEDAYQMAVRWEQLAFFNLATGEVIDNLTSENV